MPLFEPMYKPSQDKFLYFFGKDEDWERLIIGNCRANKEVYLFSSRKYTKPFPRKLKRVKSEETLKRVLYHVSLNQAIVFIDLCTKNTNINDVSAAKTVCKVVFKLPMQVLSTYCKYNGLKISSKRSIKYMTKYK